MSGNKAVGVDWSSGEWLAIVYEDGEYSHPDVETSIQPLWERYGEEAERIVVDVPIGLLGDDMPGETPDVRPCDRDARSFIGTQYRSVFNPPVRPIIEEEVWKQDDGYQKAKRLQEEITGKSLIRQALNISRGIAQVDELLRNDGDSDKLVEGHPEVSFAALADPPIRHSKKRAAGFAERLNALRSAHDVPGEMLHEITQDVLDEGYGQAGVDDVLDAWILAVTADAESSALESLPEDGDSVSDGRERPMQIVFCPRDAF